MSARLLNEQRFGSTDSHPSTNVSGLSGRRLLLWGTLLVATILLATLAAFRNGFTFSGSSPASISGPNHASAVVNIGVLVFREGLECVLVLAAITAGMTGSERECQRFVAVGAGIGFAATLLTWGLAVHILADLAKNVSALAVQAGTGLLAILVLLLVMNWFFHRAYWTGWISLHTKRKQQLLKDEKQGDDKVGLLWGMGLLGFTSFYREGFEVVLFLQSYRLRLGGAVVLHGAVLGILFSGVVAILTFVAHRRLPYRKMLVLTGLMLAVVLLVMVGEQVQEMQLAHWLPRTEVSGLAKVIPSWMSLWFSIFPTVETLAAQVVAGILVFGSYASAQSIRTSVG